MLTVDGLKVEVDGEAVLNGVDLSVDRGSVVYLIGPNGSGKSSLALSVIGSPSYELVSGGVLVDGVDISGKSVDEIAKMGVFLVFQNPVSIPGVSVFRLLKSSYEHVVGKHESVVVYKKKVEKCMDRLGMSKDLLSRSVNDGFSGGEKKKLELLQAMLLKPKYVLLDEVDSGLDVDSLKRVGGVVKDMVDDGVGFLVVTHNRKLVEYVSPDFCHVMKNGSIVKSGGPEIVDEIDRKGYEGL